ncbi:hypothetical protein GCM10012275_63790 [Longimycelium tulufanense]|uniref:RiboL-PSP-HEPN domain-containing protein n=1 Tax=Longimycelium tulufanense TaxID=907463 RepID=A0A8J3CES4_9PSEU|nr:HEPN domain-containing protein [Longimycelium tulufanense]GGM84364.1 hypothetical protein GCM10012275_63790 [Longimycelium tulufanense]
MTSKVTKTEALKVFEKNINRARAFLRIFGKGEEGRRQGQPTNDEKELLRGSLVFAVGALDAYLSDLILEIVPKHAPKNEHVQKALSAIAKSDPGLVLRVSLAPDDKSRRDEFRDALAAWLENQSFHGPKKVMIALDHVGCTLKWSEFDSKTEIDTATELDRVTKERHGIVHRGEKPDVRKDPAEKTVDLIETIAKTVDAAVIKHYT